ncbi:hypothetical protein E2562_000263 [Oryza meyeriana var. granulata]|uniref:Uncharacterized protein n=1 Tax=Oryza meyeriana var. granulata TaxID=110450 RepID=A0A6G1CMJ7_9ORYZ|nr:hypothetical protein E2562_000263 [Oryza meyeriana var. granulata]
MVPPTVEEVVPGFVDRGGVGLPGALELLEVDIAGAVEEAVAPARLWRSNRLFSFTSRRDPPVFLVQLPTT